jgi:hypothetical protein
VLLVGDVVAAVAVVPEEDAARQAPHHHGVQDVGRIQPGAAGHGGEPSTQRGGSQYLCNLCSGTTSLRHAPPIMSICSAALTPPSSCGPAQEAR